MTEVSRKANTASRSVLRVTVILADHPQVPSREIRMPVWYDMSPGTASATTPGVMGYSRKMTKSRTIMLHCLSSSCTFHSSAATQRLLSRLHFGPDIAQKAPELPPRLLRTVKDPSPECDALASPSMAVSFSFLFFLISFLTSYREKVRETGNTDDGG